MWSTWRRRWTRRDAAGSRRGAENDGSVQVRLRVVQVARDGSHAREYRFDAHEQGCKGINKGKARVLLHVGARTLGRSRTRGSRRPTTIVKRLANKGSAQRGRSGRTSSRTSTRRATAGPWRGGRTRSCAPQVHARWEARVVAMAQVARQGASVLHAPRGLTKAFQRWCEYVETKKEHEGKLKQAVARFANRAMFRRSTGGSSFAKTRKPAAARWRTLSTAR